MTARRGRGGGAPGWGASRPATRAGVGRGDRGGGDTQQVRVALEAMTRSLRGAVDPDTVPKVVFAPAGSVCDCAGTATTATRCAFLDSTSAFPELRSGPRQVAFWSSLYDLSGGTTSAARDPTAPLLHRYVLTDAGEVVEEVWTGSHVTSCRDPRRC